jgi:hypothetical protein
LQKSSQNGPVLRDSFANENTRKNASRPVSQNLEVLQIDPRTWIAVAGVSYRWLVSHGR